MKISILKFISEHPDGLVFAVTFFFLGVLVWVTIFITKWKERGGLFEKWRDTFPEIKVKLEHIGKQLDVLPKMHIDIELLKKEYASSFAVTKSPITLNEKGSEVAKSIKASEIIDTHYTALLEKVDKQEPKNAYDIQEVSFAEANKISELLDDKNIDQLKEVAFKNGVSMLDMYFILGVLLRDRILKERELLIEDIDNHNPVD